MGKFFVAICCALLFPLTALAAIEEDMQTARTLIQQKNEKAAATLLEKVLNAQDASIAQKAQAHFLFTRCDAGGDETLEHFRNAAELAPENATYQEGYAWELYKNKQYDNAAAQAEKAVALMPNAVGPLSVRALALRELNESEKALSAFAAIIRMDGKNYIHYMRRGMLHAKLKNDTEALSDFEEARKRNPPLAVAGQLYYQAALILHRLGSFEDATVLYKEALMATSDVKLKEEINLALQLINADKSIYQAASIIESNPSKASTLLQTLISNPKLGGKQKAESYKLLSMIDVMSPEALTYIAKAMELDPDSVKIRLQSAIIYARQKFFAKSIEDATEVIKMEPAEVDAFIIRGMAYSELKEHSKALVDFDSALKLKKSDFVTTMRATSLYELGNYDVALPELESVKNSRDIPQDISGLINFKIAKIYHSKADYAKAIEHYEAANAHLPPQHAMKREVQRNLQELKNVNAWR